MSSPSHLSEEYHYAAHRQWAADHRHFYPRSKPEGAAAERKLQSTEPPPPSHEEIAEFVPLQPLKDKIDEV